MNSSADNGTLDQKILTEQIRLLYRPIVPVLAANVLVSFALILGLWSVQPHARLIAWFGSLAFIQLVRYLLYRYYLKTFAPLKCRQFASYFTIGACLNGIIWGSSGILLFTDGDIGHQLFLVLALFGMGSGASTVQQSYLPAFYTYFFTTLIPITIVLLVHDGTIQIAMSIMLIAYIISIGYYASNIHRSLINSLKLRFENVDLVAQLREQKDEAERANLAKSKFLAAASHDLRQPLHALTLFTSVLNDSTQSPQNRKVVRQIDSSVQALEALFNALLDISRLDAGTMKVDKHHFRLQPILDRLRNDFEPQAHEKGIQLIIPICNDIVYSDSALLEQILRNFVSNAIRYTQTGTVELRCGYNNDQLAIRVIDTGIGIPVEERERIFEEFHQLNNPERDRSKGLGLGLAIVRRTADLLGHPIDVFSKNGQGSVFSIHIEQGKHEKVLEQKNPVFNDTSSSYEAALFVVIDDENSVRAGMRERIALWGYDVVCAADLDEALAGIRHTGRKPNGIIADYRLRNNRTGIEVIKAIHAEYGDDISALIITGDTAAEQLREVNQSGYQMLHKPVAPAKLRTFLRNAKRQSDDLTS